ncbi:MAG TPA: M28 family peptidase [Thermoanaerobaculia bacterium]|nr:M28 family peptidase [Thermoanaerobaculia bacterium]
MRRALTIALPISIVFALALWRSHGVAPRDASTPASEFSSARAMDVLRELGRDGTPHPVGTRPNAIARELIVARFRSLGYETAIQRRFACNASATCANIENILARRPNARGSAVLLMAHYDSVGAGPGVSDDLMGTAALLEVARALQKDATQNPVMFLVTDGEEAGLLGAEAFTADANLMRDVGVVVNVENRGTFGGSNMFETSSGNRWLARHLANALPRPMATSFFYAIYSLLPNDTDVTIFKREGKAAVNFAAIRGVNWYHTPYDDLAHASPRTLQHHGENVLATARTLANSDLDARSSSDATYFDILGFTLVWWPQEWTLWMAVVSLLLLVAAARKVPPRAMTFGVLTAFVTIALAALLGSGIGWLARLRAGDMTWVAHPEAPVAAMWLTGLASALLAAAMFRKWSEPLPMLYGIAIVWHTIGIALCLTLGGAAFIFVVPAVAVTICALLHASEMKTGVIAATAGAILIFPLGLLLYEALGGPMMAAIAIFIGILATFVAPLFASFRVGLVVAALAIVCAIIAIALPAYDQAKPRRLNVLYVDDPAAPTPRWITGSVTPKMSTVAAFTKLDPSLTPWSNASGFAAPAPALQLARPLVTQEPIANGVRVRVRSQRQANRITLVFRGGTVQRMNGIALPPKPARFRERASDWRFATASATEELVVDIETKGLTALVVSDSTYGLPSVGSTLAGARDQSEAFESHEGDLTIVRTRVK